MLTNSGTGLQLNRELIKWAKETYPGLAEEEQPTLALDKTALLPFTGRYVSDMSVIDISPSGDGGLTLELFFPRQPSKRTKRSVTSRPSFPPDSR